MKVLFLVHLWVLCAFRNTTDVSPKMLLVVAGKKVIYTHIVKFRYYLYSCPKYIETQNCIVVY